MGLKDYFVKKIDRVMNDAWKKGGQTSWHSNFFHRHFEGYRENVVPGKKGKRGHVERFYGGNYYITEQSTLHLIMTRFLYGILILCAFLLYAQSCLTQQVAANYSIYVSLVQVIDIFFFLWLAYIYCCYLLTGKKMTSGEYKSGSVRLTQVTRAAGIALTVTFAAKVIYAASLGIANISNIINAALLLISALSLMVVYMLETKVKYSIEASEYQEKSGFEIS